MTTPAASAVLISDSDIISRHAIADYLRHRGYAVVEAAATDEAMMVLGEATLQIDEHGQCGRDLCESGPRLARPCEPQSVVDYIKRLRAARTSAGG